MQLGVSKNIANMRQISSLTSFKHFAKIGVLLCALGTAPACYGDAGETKYLAGVIGLLQIPTLSFQGECWEQKLGSRDPFILVFASARSSQPIGRVRTVYRPIPQPGPNDSECFSPAFAVHWFDGRAPVELATSEIEEDQPAVIVRERRGFRFRIALTSGTVWIDGDPKLYATLKTLLSGDSAFVSDTNFSLIRSSPRGKRLHLESLPDRSVLNAKLIEIATIKRHSWAHVDFTIEDTNGEANPPATPPDGWLPLYDKKGFPTVWFNSRD